MRSLPLHGRAIQVSTPSGELKRIRVSGLAKTRMLWLFRNFTILDFSVLSNKQQQAVVRMWQATPNGRPAGDSLELIGWIDGFVPKLAAVPEVAQAPKLPSPVKVATTAAAVAFAKAPAKPAAAKLGAKAARRAFTVRTAFGASAGWTPIAAFLLAGALYVGQLYLRPQQPTGARPMPRSTTQPVAPPATVQPAAAPELKRLEVIALPRTASEDPPPPAMAVSTSPVRTQAHAAPLPAAPMPQAMARREPADPAKPPRTVAPSAKTEVLLRVHVDAEGHTQSIEVIDGNRHRAAAAIAAAQRWSFHPCSTSDCAHTLRFTDSGDSSHLQGID